MGAIYKPKYKASDGTIRESAAWWCSTTPNGRMTRESTGTTQVRCVTILLLCAWVMWRAEFASGPELHTRIEAGVEAGQSAQSILQSIRTWTRMGFYETKKSCEDTANYGASQGGLSVFLDEERKERLRRLEAKLGVRKGSVHAAVLGLQCVPETIDPRKD